MSFIGDYVHYYKKDYLQYSITQNTPTSFNPNQVLEEQLRDIKRMLEEKYKHEKFDFAGIEDQLNFYFYNINNTHLENNMTDEQFQQVHNAIMAKINAGLVKIDPFTLSSAVNKGGIDEKALQQQIQLRDKKIKTIEQWRLHCQQLAYQASLSTRFSRQDYWMVRGGRRERGSGW